MKAVLWYIIYFAIGIGVWAFFKITTRDEREEWMWQAITYFTIAVAISWLVQTLL